jgi:superfamily II DNA/RNA helicase
MREFRRGTISVLVATDVAARGLGALLSRRVRDEDLTGRA